MIREALLLFLTGIAHAVPSVNLPFNAQVPPVARVNQPFHFVFSESTFTSATGSFSYALAGFPGWLRLDGGKRTFSGTPGAEDAGSSVVTLVAMDDIGSISVPVTLVVSKNSGPGLGLPVSNQLPAFGPLTSANSFSLPPSSAMSFSFSSNTFTNTNDKTVYYAMCANNTPLPSWITFDPKHLAFSGTTPEATSPSGTPQSFGIQVAASDVVGFSGAVATFQLVIETHILAFSNSVLVLNVTTGGSLNFSGLRTSLSLDGRPASPSDLKQVTAATPSWMSLDTSILALSGIAPLGNIQLNVSVTAVDVYGNVANTTVLVQTPSNASQSLMDPIGPLNASIGSDLRYSLKAGIKEPSLSPAVNIGAASTWLSFNSSTSEIYGHVPNNLKPQQVSISVAVSQGSQSQSEVLVINVIAPTGSSSQVSTSATANTSGKSWSIGDGQGTASAPGVTEQPQKHWIAAAVIVPLFVVIGASTVLYCLLRRRRQRALADEMLGLPKSKISRPIFTEEHPQAVKAVKGINAQQKADQRASSRMSKAPVIDFPALRASATSDRLSRLRFSRTSLDGASQSNCSYSWRAHPGDPEISRPISTVMPEFALISEEHTPQREGSIIHHAQRRPADAFMPSASLDTLPRKQYSTRRKRRSNVAFGSAGVLSTQRMSGIGHGRYVPSQDNNILVGSKGLGHGDGGVLGGPSGFNIVRKSWHNPRRSSDWETTTEDSRDYLSIDARSFPRPPTSSTTDRLGLSHSIPEIDDDDFHHATIRQVPPPPLIHTRNKTLYRAHRRGKSTSRPSELDKPDPLLVFHKKRLLQWNSPSPLFSARASSRISAHHFPLSNMEFGRSLPAPHPTTTPSHSRKPSSLPTNSPSPRHNKSHVNCGFKPHLRSQSYTNNSILSDNSQFESADSEASQNLAPPHIRNLSFEQADTDNESSGRPSRFFNHPNPLAENSSDNDVAGKGLKARLAQRLSLMRAGAVGGEEFRMGGKSVGQSVGTGLREGDPGNRSMRGMMGNMKGEREGEGSSFL